MRPGDTVTERFEIERLAGSGGMGSVYRARDRANGGLVALKILHRGGEQDHARFEREARILAELRHPGVVRYVAHGVTPDRQRYLAIEWLEGEDLADRLDRGRPSVAETTALLRRVAEGLAAAHARGIVHRDIKPKNIFLPGGDIEQAKILDFGIARVGLASRAATRTGATLGTPGYMAPEQARGDRRVDARADVFSLGCVVFDCLTGRPPFLGDHVMAVLAKILLEDAPRVSELRGDVPPALDELVARMLSKDPDVRPRDASELLEAAQAIHVPAEPRAAPLARSRPPQELTAGEQRLLSVVLVGGAGAADTQPGVEPNATSATLPVTGGDAAAAPMRDIVRALGAELEALADGSYLVTLAGAGAGDDGDRAWAGAKVATDQAAQAARCALALRALLPDVPMALATGRGVASGPWPVGQVIDRAVELLHADEHEGGQVARGVRLDEVTAGLLDARFEVGGGAAGLMLLAERPDAEGVRTLLGKPTPCVGRDRQLQVLASMYGACVAEPEARAVVVKAPAGAGKSRLRLEFLRALAAPGAPQGGAALPAPEVWIGRGDPMRAGSPFGLLAAALRGAAGIQDGEPLGLRQRKLRARVARHVDAAEQSRVTEFLGEMIGVPFSEDQSEQAVQLRAARRDPMLMGDQMRRAWEDLVAAECAARPLVLVLEDLQWGDLPTVRFVDAALRHAQDAPLLVLALARPEVDDLFPKLWADRNVMELRLGELSRKAAERLVREILGEGTAAAVVDRIVERASGNAFYLEELIRAVAAAGAGDLEGIPETVLAMVHARLEGLDPAARRALRGASVFGQVFWRGGVTALLGGARRGVDAAAWLPHFVERELVERRPASKFPGEEEYAFRHALVREAAYVTLTAADRALGHRLAGVWLERAGESDPIALAEHFDRGGEPARAVRWFLRGAEQALEGGDLAAALDRAERGARHRDGAGRERGSTVREGPANAESRPTSREGPANAESRPTSTTATGGSRPSGAVRKTIGAPAPSSAPTREDEVLGALRLVQAEARRWRGEFEEAQRCAVLASRRLHRGSLLWFRAADEVMSASSRRGDYVLTVAWAREVAAEGARRDDAAPEPAPPAEDAGPSIDGASAAALRSAPTLDRAGDDTRAAQVIALCSAARQLFHAGRYDDADALLSQVVALAGDLDALEPRAAAEVHRLRGARARHVGDLAGDVAGYAAALEGFARAGDARNACNARVSLGFAYIELGDFRRAGEALEAALAEAERMGLHTVVTRARQNLGLVRAARGEIDEALALERAVAAESREQGNLRFEGWTRIYVAMIAHRAGDHAAAEAEARAAAELLEGTPPARAGALAALACALVGEGRIDAALGAAREAMDTLAQFGGIEEFESLVRVAWIEAARASGDRDGARAAAEAGRARLLERAAAIHDEAWRESFLRGVWENDRLMALARTLGVA